MFQFSFLTTNALYIFFAATYVLSMGLFSYTKFEKKKQERQLEKTEAKEIVIDAGYTHTDSDKKVCFYYDYMAVDITASLSLNHSTEASFFSHSDFKYSRSLWDFSLFSRPPPVV